MTNSPPANVKRQAGLAEGEPGRVLSHGIDSLVLAMTLRWPEDEAFRRLAELKQQAHDRGDDEPMTVVVDLDGSPARFVVKPHGKQGAEWLLVGREFSISLGNWQEPKQRPSAMVEVRSETLWTHGPDVAVDRAERVLVAMGAVVVAMKPSRVDVCVDVLMRARTWRSDLKDHFVTRARKVATYESNRELSGFAIGSGAVSARIYDKVREIREQSNKVWMFEKWGFAEVPEGHVIVRVEFQLRRDALRETNVNNWSEVSQRLPKVWAYCTRKWLRLARNARVHHTQQRVIGWWRLVQDGFRGAQDALPVVREKAINADKRRLAGQSVGTLSSVAALMLDDREATEPVTLDRRSMLHAALDEALKHAPQTGEECTRRIDRKRAKYGRSAPGFGSGSAESDVREVGSATNPRENPA